ncbi:MAG: hypothetical protein AUG51_24220 [Acidobacteria bacterium 13_1_20CM_3_53_8]|nr:MAG: hypothetical protein AUG51_24220 [Acidobacteria bacterium 13_1_20CM_3_53_8]
MKIWRAIKVISLAAVLMTGLSVSANAQCNGMGNMRGHGHMKHHRGRRVHRGRNRHPGTPRRSVNNANTR